MTLDPGVVIADDVLMVEARQQRYLALDAAKLPAGWVHLDPLYSVVTAVQLVLDLEHKHTVFRTQLRDRQTNS